jgi:ribosomal protein L24
MTVVKRYDFQILNGEPSDEVHEGDRVTVVSGPMKGSDGVIKEIREREGQILLTITFSMFQDKMHVAVPGIHVSDVRLKSAEAQQLIQDPVISHFEDQLIELLCHLHGKKGSHELNKEDQRQLRFLYQYASIQFDDPTNRAKFAALMLICAYLMNDKAEVQRRQQEVEQLLKSDVDSELRDSVVRDSVVRDSVTPVPVIPNNDISCYLTMSLFIVTHNPEYRCQVKAWRQSHSDCPLAIRRFLSIAKQIRC